MFFYAAIVLCASTRQNGIKKNHRLCAMALVGLSRLELPTSRLSGACSNQLSYNPILVEVSGFEPLTPCLQSRCSTNWAIPPRYMPDKNDTSLAKPLALIKTLIKNIIVLKICQRFYWIFGNFLSQNEKTQKITFAGMILRRCRVLRRFLNTVYS